jgi:hypothetical protein
MLRLADQAEGAMSRRQQYILSRVVLGVGYVIGFAAFIALGIAAGVKQNHTLAYSAAGGLALGIAMMFAGGRLDPRERWEKASGSLAAELPASRDSAKISHAKALARQEAEIFGVRTHQKRGWRKR